MKFATTDCGEFITTVVEALCWVGNIAGPPGKHVAIGRRGGERDLVPAL